MHYIYVITNLINKKVYIGQSKKPTRRFSEHKAAARNNKPMQQIHYAIIKHGIKNFTFTVIFGCKTIDDTNWAERYFIRKYNSLDRNNGYNLHIGGYYCPPQDGSRKSMSGENNPFYGKKHPPEIMAKIKKTREENPYVMPEEDKKLRSEKMKGENNPFYGKTHTAETIAKGVAANTGKKHTDAHKQKISAAQKGIKRGPQKNKSTKPPWNKIYYPIEEITKDRKAGMLYPELVKKYNINLSYLSELLSELGLGRGFIPRIPWNKKKL